MLTSGRGPQHRGQTVLLALLGVLLMAFAAAADVYYTYQNGVYVLSNIQRTEQFKPAVATEEAEDQNADDATVAFKPTTFESLLVKYCGRYQVDINLVKAVMMAESNMRHTNNDGVVITSAKGAVGIMQVMPATGAVAETVTPDTTGGVFGRTRMSRRSCSLGLPLVSNAFTQTGKGRGFSPSPT